jgi:hypothetical protein
MEAIGIAFTLGDDGTMEQKLRLEGCRLLIWESKSLILHSVGQKLCPDLRRFGCLRRVIFR